MPSQESIALVMPAHNEADTIEEVISGFHKTLEAMNVHFDIVVVEDGSTDGTKDILRRLENELELILIMDEVRRGYSDALITAMEAIDHDYVVFTDSDGQHHPDDLHQLWRHRTEAPIIVGGRYDRAEGTFRRLMSKTFKIIAILLFDYPDIQDMTAPFRMIRRDAALDIIPDISYMQESFWTEFTIRAEYYDYEQLEIPVRHRERLGPGDTRVYNLLDLPSIVRRQLIGMWELRKEL